MVTEKTKRLVDEYNKGLVFYKQRKWDQAISAFQTALNIEPDDGPSKLYLERAQDFKKNPPSEDWDGVYVMTTK